ncbi:response regulator transcription factor [Solibacillus sp. CAU 1738]|uniref:response regulator transcription factor n=1 Tax=Solibacillus sp. CAU 1738 TaxID=3140363 RepID=UPI00325FFBFD
MKQKVLIVEDDALFRTYLCEALQERYDVVTAADAESAQQLYLLEYPCLILLDLVLPKMSGEEFCKWIRAQGRQEIGIIMISSKTSTADKVRGLKIGADSYLTKPINSEELLAHIEAVLRRTGLFCQKIVHNGLCIKPRKGEIILNDEHLHLTKHEFLLLYHLIDHPNIVFSRAELVAHIYPFHEKDILDRTIDVHVKNLRDKIEIDPTNPQRILTVRGIGYKYVL